MAKVKIVNKSGFDLPKYATLFSAGMDLRAYIPSEFVPSDDSGIIYPEDEKFIPITLLPFERKMIHTEIYIQLPNGYESQIRPRSGLAIKHGITVINTPGTIDPDFIGEVCVLLVNLSQEPFYINHGDRIAQMIINKFENCEWDEVDILTPTERGEGGFSSTGIK